MVCKSLQGVVDLSICCDVYTFYAMSLFIDNSLTPPDQQQLVNSWLAQMETDFAVFTLWLLSLGC